MHRFISQRRTLLFLVATFAFISSSNSALSAEPLVWKFTAGDQHYYQMIQEMQMSMDLGPTGNTETSFKQTMDMVWKVESLNEDGSAKVTQHFNRIRMDINAPGQDPVQFDTQSEDAPQGYAAMLAPMMTALTTDKFTMTMAPNGEISNVEIPKAFTEAISRGPGAAMMGGFATEEGLKKMAKQGSLTLPTPADLTEGHEWSTSIDIDNPAAGKITIDTTYRYAGAREIDGQQFEIFIPSINTSFNAEEGDQAAQIEVTNQETTGEILFNRSAGRLESSTIDQKMTNTITVAGNTINQDITQKVTFKIIAPEETKE